MEFLPVEIDTLTTIGLIIILTYLGSKVIQRIGIPQVVGFILVGVLLGSSFLNIVPISLVRELDFINEIALGLIGFDMGPIHALTSCAAWGGASSSSYLARHSARWLPLLPLPRPWTCWPNTGPKVQ